MRDVLKESKKEKITIGQCASDKQNKYKNKRPPYCGGNFLNNRGKPKKSFWNKNPRQNLSLQIDDKVLRNFKKFYISEKKMALLLQCRFVSVILLFTACVTVTEVKAATEYNRYLAHLFQKYGNGGTMSFEVSCLGQNRRFIIIIILMKMISYAEHDLYSCMNTNH